MAGTKCMTDLKLASNKHKYAKPRDLDRLFIAINSGTSMALKAAKQAVGPGKAATARDDKKALSRVEFLGMLVHLAIMRFVMTGELTDVSKATHQLLGEIRDHVHPTMCIDPDDFRRSHCYTEAVTLALEHHEATLRAIFKCLSSGGRGGKGAQMLSLDEWENFVEALGFVGVDISDREVRFAFVWSRMVVVDTRTERGHLRETCLPFEGFM